MLGARTAVKPPGQVVPEPEPMGHGSSVPHEPSKMRVSLCLCCVVLGFLLVLLVFFVFVLFSFFFWGGGTAFGVLLKGSHKAYSSSPGSGDG